MVGGADALPAQDHAAGGKVGPGNDADQVVDAARFVRANGVAEGNALWAQYLETGHSA